MQSNELSSFWRVSMALKNRFLLMMISLHRHELAEQPGDYR